MSPYLLLQVFCVIAPLISANYEIDKDKFLQEFSFTKELSGKVYMLSRRDRPIDKEAAKGVCRQHGGYLAKLDGGMEEFQHLKSAVLESSLLASGFLIDEVGNDIHPRIDYLDDLTGKTCTFIRQLSTTNYFAVFDPSPCHYSAKFICEVPVPQSNSGSAMGAQMLLQKFHISPRYKNSLYLFSKDLKPFNFVNALYTCQRHGGYLLILSDMEEKNLVQRLFIKLSKPVPGYRFYTSGNRRRDHRTYVWGNNFTPIRITSDGIPWGMNEPSGSYECIAITLSLQMTFEMGIWDCDGDHPGFFVCEVYLPPL